MQKHGKKRGTEVHTRYSNNKMLQGDECTCHRMVQGPCTHDGTCETVCTMAVNEACDANSTIVL